MPKAGTPQTPPQAQKAAPTPEGSISTSNPPQTPNQTPSAPLPAPVEQAISDAEAIAAGSSPVGPPELDSNSKAADMEMGTPANPRRGPFPAGKVTAFALVRAEDGMWRAVQYKIVGNIVVKAKTKEPDLKALLAAQITDCLALDTPLFNDEEGPRE